MVLCRPIRAFAKVDGTVVHMMLNQSEVTRLLCSFKEAARGAPQWIYVVNLDTKIARSICTFAVAFFEGIVWPVSH